MGQIVPKLAMCKYESENFSDSTLLVILRFDFVTYPLCTNHPELTTFWLKTVFIALFSLKSLCKFMSPFLQSLSVSIQNLSFVMGFD